MEKLPKNWLTLDASEVEKVANLCPPGTYRDFSQAELPSFVPSSLREKCIGARMMASGLRENVCVYVCNLKRSDKGELDENPLIWTYTSGNVSASGYLYQHGTWSGRTTSMLPEVQSLIHASGVAAASMSAASGRLTDLMGSSDAGAFDAAAVKVIHRREES